MKGAELQAFARMVGKTFVARGMKREELEDAEQLAALQVLTDSHAYRRRFRRSLPLQGNRAYYFRGATCVPAIRLAQQRAVLSVTEHALRHEDVTPLFSRGQLVGCGGSQDEGAVDAEDDRMPDAGLRAEEYARARARLWDVLEDHIAAMDDIERQALKMLLGIGTPQRDPEEVAAVIGKTTRFISNVARRLGDRVQKDAGARRARRVMIQHREDIAA